MHDPPFVCAGKRKRREKVCAPLFSSLCLFFLLARLKGRLTFAHSRWAHGQSKHVCACPIEKCSNAYAHALLRNKGEKQKTREKKKRKRREIIVV
jgi:hypothetical protein